GMGLLEGEKMSSSKGHVVLPADAIEEYGADTVRFFLLNSAEPWQDYDWRAEEVATTKDQLARFWRRAEEVIDLDAPGERPDLERIDRWLLSKLQGVVADVTESMESFSTRHASQDAFYQVEEHLRWYRKRADLDRPGARWTRQEVLRTRLRLLAPIVPFLTNELHEQLTGEPVEDTAWPEPDPAVESTRVELEETLVASLADDVRDIVKVTDTDPDRIRVFTAANWKRGVFEEVVETGPDVGEVMGKVMQYDAMRDRGNAVNQLVRSLVEDARERSAEELTTMLEIDETDVYESAAGFLAREFDATVDVVHEGDTDEEKAEQAEPFRPAILLE
ncbi:MAG: class I tRNA ligase family protein, partial [Halobacterium sp.]